MNNLDKNDTINLGYVDKSASERIQKLESENESIKSRAREIIQYFLDFCDYADKTCGCSIGEDILNKATDFYKTTLSVNKLLLDFAEPREKRIKELEADNRLLEKRGSEILVQLLDMNKKFKEAKELLQKLVDISEKTYPDDNAFDVDFEELIRKTEQFLNQREEENKGNE